MNYIVGYQLGLVMGILMTRSRNDLLHICEDYYRKEEDDVFEYCKCGARYFLNRYGNGFQLNAERGVRDDNRGTNKRTAEDRR